MSAHPRIRTFHARQGRVTDAMRRTLAEVGPRHDLRARRLGVPLVLEVGCGHGDAALAYAAAHPDVDLLAVDVHTPGIAHLLQAIDERDGTADAVPNLLVAHADAVALLDHELASASLAGIHVFFPDPWPKARHRKRRFVRPDVLDLVADRLAPGAHLAFATDVADYADSARAILDAHPAFEGGPGPRPPWRPGSGYEARGRAAGRTPVELSYRRVPDPTGT